MVTVTSPPGHMQRECELSCTQLEYDSTFESTSGNIARQK